MKINDKFVNVSHAGYLKAFNSFGAELSISTTNSNTTIIVWNSYLEGSTDLLWVRLEGVKNSVGALKTSTPFEIRVFDDSTM